MSVCGGSMSPRKYTNLSVYNSEKPKSGEQRLNVTSIPTILKYEDGNLKEHTIGAVKRENLRKMIF